MSSRRTFTSEYKRECAELVIKHGYQVKEAALAMNVGLSSLQKWLRQYRNEESGITPKETALPLSNNAFKNWKPRSSS